MWTKIHPDTVLVNLGRKGSRTISATVISGEVDLAPMTRQENDLWSEHVGGAGFTEMGAIANFGEKTGLVTPAVQAAIDSWLVAQGIYAAREHDALPLACTGAGFHHDLDYKVDILPALKDGDSSCETRMSARENDSCSVHVTLMRGAAL